MNEPVYHLEGVVHARAESLEDFDGPLDVIFLLLSKNKIEIQDVSISSILEQYLAYLDEMKRMDVEIASEFTAMASHLMLIKTKMLLSAAEQEGRAGRRLRGVRLAPVHAGAAELLGDPLGVAPRVPIGRGIDEIEILHRGFLRFRLAFSGYG